MEINVRKGKFAKNLKTFFSTVVLFNHAWLFNILENEIFRKTLALYASLVLHLRCA